jgi:hypothetical protein
MPNERDRRMRWVLPLACLLLFCGSLAPIRSNDYFWQLAAGRWMVEHRALPATDPFGVASSRTEWVDGEWLFQLLLYGIYSAGGHLAVSVAFAFGTALLFTALLALTAAETDLEVALPIVVLSWYAAYAWLRERPATLGAVCATATILILQRLRGRRRLALLVLTTILWMNIHPSAIIAPLIVAVFELGEALRGRERSFRPLARRAILPLAAAGALLVSPYGIRGIIAPLRLAAIVGEFRNEEWAATDPVEFPLFYAALAAVLLLWLARGDRMRRLPEGLVFLLLATLAIRFCRNQGLFFSSFPLLVAPFVPPAPPRMKRIIAVSAVLAFFGALAGAWWSAGIDERVFPVAAVARLRASGLKGNIYNDYGLGGFLIWNFYPERRVVTDGRNELYVAYNRESVRAEGSNRAWRSLIAGYDLKLAIFTYHRAPMRVVDTRTRRARIVPSHVALFPQKEWALIAMDPVAMVFARRDAYPADQLQPLELR